MKRWVWKAACGNFPEGWYFEEERDWDALDREIEQDARDEEQDLERVRREREALQDA